MSKDISIKRVPAIYSSTYGSAGVYRYLTYHRLILAVVFELPMLPWLKGRHDHQRFYTPAVISMGIIRGI